MHTHTQKYTYTLDSEIHSFIYMNIQDIYNTVGTKDKNHHHHHYH